MGAHAKTSATREKIINAAIGLFAVYGFEGTTLRDITDSAEITSGTFYYHFDSKEKLIPAIIEHVWPRVWKTFLDCTESRFPSLENVVVMTFEMMELMNRDQSVRVANSLDQASGQLSDEGRSAFRSRATAFTEGIATSISKTDIRDDISPQQVGELVWIAVHGCQHLSQAKQDDFGERLAKCWLVLLRGIVPPESLSYFSQFVERTAQSYRGS